MLTSYLTQTGRLLQNPGAPTSLYSTADLTSYINVARGQLAGEAECIRVIGTIATAVGQRAYNFSGINIGTPALIGIQGVIHVRRVSYNIASNQRWIPPRSWEWYDLFHLNNPVPASGPPKLWAQYGQGAAGPPSGSVATGSFYIDPPPDAVYTLNCDCVCYPLALAADGDPEALPFLWTDAVPYFAAYLALMASQTSQRIEQAKGLLELYEQFVGRARRFSNSSVNRHLSQQSIDPVQAAKISAKGAA